MTQIEVCTQRRIEQWVTALDGRTLRRIEHAGTAWFGGRPDIRGAAVIASGAGIPPVGDSFWLPDGLAYWAAQSATVDVAISVGLQSAREAAQILDATAALIPHPEHSDMAYVAVTVVAAGRAPLGVAYRVTVLAPSQAVAGAPETSDL